MNTISIITATLLRGFKEAEFSSDYPHAVCIWQDRRQKWHADARRLSMFPLQHFNRSAPEYLYFDSAKSVYLPRSVSLSDLPPQIYDPVITLLSRVNKQYGHTHMVVYEMLSQENFIAAIEQAAQVIARAHEAMRQSGQEPPPISVQPPAARPKLAESSPSILPQWLTSLPKAAKESLFEHSHPQEARESTFSAMLDAYSAASRKAVPASFASAFRARKSKAPKRPAARPQDTQTFGKRFDFGCAPTMPLPL